MRGQRLRGDLRFLQPLELEEVHHLVLDPVRIGEAALRQPPLQRHLATFEMRLTATRTVMARARLRALVPEAGRLTMPGSGAPAHPLAIAMRSRRARQIVESVHLFLPFPLRHLDEVADLEDHATNGGIVLLDDGTLVLQPQRLQGGPLIARPADATAHLTNLEELSHSDLPGPRPGHPARSPAVHAWSGWSVRSSSPGPCCPDCSTPGSWSGCRAHRRTRAPHAPDRRRSRRYPDVQAA